MKMVTPFLLVLAFAPPAPAASQIGARLEDLLVDVQDRAPTGVLIDRVLELSPLAEHDGRGFPPVATRASFRQMADEIRRSSLAAPKWSIGDLDVAARAADAGDVPIALLDFAYDRLRAGALEDGSLVFRGGRLASGRGDPFEGRRVFAAAPALDRTYRGERVVFRLPDGLRWTDDPQEPREIALDPGDGRGFRVIPPGGRVTAEYGSPGPKTARVRLVTAGGDERRASFRFDVLRLGTPVPDDTLAVTATIPHDGQFGTGLAYVYLAPGHAQIENPLVVFEGFDLDNGMHWEELYELLNQQSMLETLRALGFDSVVLDFGDATAPIQENAFVGLELISQVRAIAGSADILVGASMGGLVGRYALAWAESQAIDHGVSEFVCFDVPHGGAVVPLGIQYWLDFFSGESADAAALLAALDSPAARQMLLYHHTSPAGATGEPDPARADFLADLAAVGDWPAGSRLAGVANGSGSQLDQGFAAGAQIIRWEYESLLVDVTGNVWAVPDGASQSIFFGKIDPLFLPPDTMTVVVGGTLPWDGAPGGWRGSMAQMDTVQAPYGDIEALHDNHCFVPVISALALDHTTDPFHDVAGDGDLLAHTPFDAIRWQPGNEEHVFVSATTAQWLIDEITQTATGVDAVPASRPLSLLPGAPNPFRGATTLSFTLRRPEPVTLDVYDVQGRLVARLLDATPRDAGHHRVRWAPAAGAGVYFVRLATPDGTASRKVVRIP